MKTTFTLIFTLVAAVMAAPTEIVARGGKSSSSDSQNQYCQANQVVACCDSTIQSCNSVDFFSVVGNFFNSGCNGGSQNVQCCTQTTNQQGNFNPIAIDTCGPLFEL
ncbi:hypothetical protein K490DRAFT_56428 [Saccharata proteae CBS 121410]|uniref:Hydrophobin n=1 Tax=Saccharata proteae CBS 121410 TaxID=1314787 RepID=A0A9P4HXH2_9PEZI|nr:hypothetical protein K490DRAFT_56428 [Saccharata proteae CBS 121410]